jgi:catechol 2,3-dioxygenase-like lactoylglutathione lyase family enzyme
MLSKSPVFPSIRVSNLKLARDFYEGKLGLKIIFDKPGELLLLAGKNSRIYLYEGEKSIATHTLAVFYVKDLLKTLKELSKKGVTPIHYDFPGLKTDKDGVVEKVGKKGAWIADPDGNILGLSQIENK